MTLELARDFFLWCAILNGGILIGMALVLGLAGDWVYRAHRRWFPMSKEHYSMSVYGVLGLYKILFVVFNLVPYLAVTILH